MWFELQTMIVVSILFAGMLLCIEVGRRIGLARTAVDPESAHKGISAVEGAVFAILGLLIAFTFSGAASRFEARRLLIGQEANAIGTAYLRLAALPESAHSELRSLFSQYVDLRIAMYHDVEDRDGMRQRSEQQSKLQNAIWNRAVTASSQPGASAAAPMIVLPALNEMIDITTTREVANRNHPPTIIFLMLGGLSLLSALLVGYSMSCRGRSWLHILSYGLLISLTILVILDLEYPRRGLIRIDAADRVLVELRQMMK